MNTSNITEIEGMITLSSKGIGYVKNKEKDITIEVPREHLNRAFHGDMVLARITSPALSEDQLPKGEVVDITRRSRVGYSGVLGNENGSHCLLTGDGRMYTSIKLPAESLKGAVEGQKIFCRITSWDDPMAEPTGEVVRVLGAPLENNAEMLSLALEKGFDDDYPQAVLDEAKAIHERGIPEEDLTDRRDFRKIATITIDPVDAKDFDDAISVEFLDDGNVEVGVHIADVSHYVRTGTALDDEAYRRATSVYLVDRTIPMLPEVLSNELCSLNPHIDRLTFSATFIFDKDMNIISEWYGKSVIYSAHRYSYEDAQATLDKKDGPYLKELEYSLKVAKMLEKERFSQGAISLDQPEVKFTLDEKGVPLGVYTKVRGDTHHMIEELMLLANRKVAEYIATHEKFAKDVFVYRIHDTPDVERMYDLQQFLKRFGYNVKTDENGIIPSRELNALVASLADKPERETIQTAIVRSMAKAIYSTKNIGHYGLAFDYYTHFTSPIRRYPDLVVHRLLFEYLHDKHIEKEHLAYYEKVTSHSSQREKEAADAERASIKYKQVEYMSTRVGQVFSGVITGISQNGLYVEEKETKCEGMIRLRDLGNDFFDFNEKEYAIIGRRTKKTFRVGDTANFKVANTDLSKRIIDYVLV